MGTCRGRLRRERCRAGALRCRWIGVCFGGACCRSCGDEGSAHALSGARAWIYRRARRAECRAVRPSDSLRKRRGERRGHDWRQGGAGEGGHRPCDVRCRAARHESDGESYEASRPCRAVGRASALSPPVVSFPPGLAIIPERSPLLATNPEQLWPRTLSGHIVGAGGGS